MDLDGEDLSGATVEMDGERYVAEMVEITVNEGCEMITLSNKDCFCGCGRPKRTYQDECWACSGLKRIN